MEIIPAYDVIIDGTDNFMSRYIINDACVLSGKPLVYGAISQYEGQLAVFNFGDQQNKPVNYRDLFPLPPGEYQVLSCEEIGVLGVLPGIIGSMQANETIKILTGLGKPLVNQLLTYDALTSQSYSIEIFPNEEASVQLPKSENYFREFDYRLFCFPETDNVPEISVVQLKNMLENGDVTILDIRKNGQIRGIEKSENFHRIPFEQLKEKYTAIKGKEVVVICQAGINSRKAVMELQDLFGSHKMFHSLRGGVIEWNRYLKNHPYDGKKT
jgi:adenylyltransferase/sulfurtransferase